MANKQMYICKAAVYFTLMYLSRLTMHNLLWEILNMYIYKYVAGLLLDIFTFTAGSVVVVFFLAHQTMRLLTSRSQSSVKILEFTLN